MAKGAGRDAVISKDAVPIAGIRNASIDGAVEWMDSTDKDSAAFTSYLTTKPKSQQLTIKIDGLTDSTVLQDIFLDPAVSKALTDLTVLLPVASGTGKDTIGGTFVMTSYSTGLPYDDLMTFECTLVSSGAWTFA